MRHAKTACGRQLSSSGHASSGSSSSFAARMGVPPQCDALIGSQLRWLAEFLDWVQEDIAEADPLWVSRALTRYGQLLYDAGRPLGVFLEVINAVVDQRPEV